MVLHIKSNINDMECNFGYSHKDLTQWQELVQRGMYKNVFNSAVWPSAPELCTQINQSDQRSTKPISLDALNP